MIRNAWIFLREVRWLAVLCVVCVLAGIVLALLGSLLLGLVFAVSAVAFGMLANTDL